eukprot:TRINITY_DN7161_c0_g1_i2.p1 TRINITY_DN7161_c0_g1~~TRINITY_DN7161_c0_g1_i2.p1  ORF type:complete len:217 (+),score=28.18 TRINITY_DN7161_c0_g1_i2:209-859(+)
MGNAISNAVSAFSRGTVALDPHEQDTSWRSSLEVLPLILDQLPPLFMHSHLEEFESAGSSNLLHPQIIHRPCIAGCRWHDKRGMLAFFAVDSDDVYYFKNLYCIELDEVRQTIVLEDGATPDWFAFMDAFVSAWQQWRVHLLYPTADKTVFHSHQELINGLIISVPIHIVGSKRVHVVDFVLEKEIVATGEKNFDVALEVRCVSSAVVSGPCGTRR